MRVTPPVLAILAALAASPLASHAQAGAPVRVAAAGAELRASPDGGRVGTLSRGASLTPGASNGAWREVTVEGWVPAASVAPAGAGGRVAVQGSATLRSAPDGGGPVATAFAGAVLREVERRGGWVRVRRTGWVRAEGIGGAASARAPAATAARPARDTSARTRTASATRPSSSPAATPTSTPAPARPAAAARPAAPAAATARTAASTSKPAVPTPTANRPAAQTPSAVATTAARPATPARTASPPATTPARPASVPAKAAMSVRPAAPAASTPAAARRTPVVLHGAPGGSQVAVVDPGASVQVLARQGAWTRVRVEGWTRSPVPGAPVASPTPAASAAVPAGGAVTLAALRADPDAYVGREVDWSLRFVAVQVADSIRSDFRPGEPFVLARDPNGETGYVYVAVSPQQAAAMRRLAPLQQFRMAGRIRVPRSPLMGHPIVELVRLR